MRWYEEASLELGLKNTPRLCASASSAFVQKI